MEDNKNSGANDQGKTNQSDAVASPVNVSSRKREKRRRIRKPRKKQTKRKRRKPKKKKPKRS